MKMIHVLIVGIFVICCSITLQAKEQQLTCDGGDYSYELMFDDGRISVAAIRRIWRLSPWACLSITRPFINGSASWKSSSGETLINKIFMAPSLELCITGSIVDCYDRNPEVPDEAFLKNAARNLETGEEQIEMLREEKLPSVLEPVRAYLLLHLKLDLEREKARYDYLESGDLGPMKRILCSECSCGRSEEMLLEQLKSASDGKRKLELTKIWHNQALECIRKVHPPSYPIDAWNSFLRDFGIKEQRKPIPIY